MIRFLAFALVLAHLAGPAYGQASTTPTSEELETQLRATCDARMRELRRLEEEQLANIRWQDDASGTHAQYAGYAPDYTCKLSPSSGDTPIARMQYQEIHFEKRGATVAEAMKAPPQALRIEDVTQVFVYRDGAWK